MAQQVVVEISPSGSINIDAKGFTGKGCEKATEQLEVVLGGAGKTSKKRKPEFFAAPSTKAGTKLTF